MKYYLAPLEGITNYIYRNAYHKYFEKMDKYFTPFISTNQHMSFSTKELKELNPLHNEGLNTVSQILSNKSDDYIRTAIYIHQLGYEEINLNLGCPSNTVVAKNKGSGFLFHKDLLNRFLEDIYRHAPMKISIKTRLGKHDPDEFYELIKIFNQYPMTELIIHPRIQKDMYKNVPNLKVFSDVLSSVQCPVCYNGDIFSVADYQHLETRFPEIDTWMLGRGIIGNPSLVGQIKTGQTADKKVFREFHDTLYEAYQGVMSGERNILFKMKELWFYMMPIFSEDKKYTKKIRKCETLHDYDVIVNQLFSEEIILPDSTGYRTVADELKMR